MISLGIKDFFMRGNGPQINHLTFADDTIIIIFCNGGQRPLERVMDTMKAYESISGQLINKNKRCFAVATNTSYNIVARVQNITEMNHQQFPIKYLGCPLITGKKKLAYFSDMVSRIVNMI